VEEEDVVVVLNQVDQVEVEEPCGGAAGSGNTPPVITTTRK
jgi:hypothetical protein